MKRTLILLYLLLSAVCFAQEKIIMNVLEQQQTAWNKGNLDDFMQGYWKSDSLLFAGSKGPTYGWQKTLDNYRKSYPNTAAMGTLTFSDLKVTMLGKEHASVFGRWKLTREKDSPGGVFTLVFQKFKDGWKIISDHSS